MEDPKTKQADPQLSQVNTLASPISSLLRPPARTEVPEFPVKDWDRYEFLAFLGQGGMGKVFLARDRRLGREVAIKFVRLDDGQHLERFMVEARAQARVDHAHVCKVFEVGEVEGKVFITMQHIPGSSFDVAAAELSLEQKVMVLRDAAQGVHEAHRVGIIHRDLKPSNIMVAQAEDGSLETFVMDFGLAREWNQDVTETGSVLGTPSFMSPEQARGEVSGLDRRTDVYSLGATLYQAVTGRPPVTGANALEILSSVVTTEVEPMRALTLDVPKDLEAITLKCLEKERSKRYDSARALAEDLDRFLAGEPVVARPTGTWYRIQRRLRKHKHLAAVAAVALVVVLVALGAALKTRRDAGRRERLAQQFTEAMARIESLARYSALSPLHDIRPDLKTVQAHMTRLQEDIQQAGALAKGPGHYALGRGYWTLDDAEKAREHLQMAWDAGFREPRAAYALALVLGQQYREKLLEAERIPSPDQREARKREIESTLRDPALALLRRAKGSDAPSPAYLESLLAFYEGRLDEALERLKTLEDDQPWFYEASLLRGSLLQARAWKRWNQGQREAAHGDFEAGRTALAAAAVSGRSAPVVHAAMAELELNALIMEKYGQGQVEPAYTHGMAAVQTALAAQADHAPSLILQAALVGHLAEFRMDHGQQANDLIEQAVSSARKAVAAAPSRADARVALGRAYYQWGSARADQNLDPTEPLNQGLQALEALSPEKREYTVENLIGLIHQTWSDFAEQRGQDPAPHLSGAIAAYERATRMEPHLLPAWINLGTCLRQRAVLPGASDPDAGLQAALKVLEEAHTLNPKHFVPYFVQGKVLCDMALRKRNRGEDPEPDLWRSLEANRKGLAINASVPHLHNGAGLAQMELARTTWETGGDPRPLLAQARASFQKAIEVAPGQVSGHTLLGDLLVLKARCEAGPEGDQTLREAEGQLRKALKISPGNQEPLSTLGLVEALRIERAQHQGGNPIQNLDQGEATLAKALSVDARNRDALHYLGELRSAAVRWKVLHHQAMRRDFDLAEEPYRGSLDLAPDSLEIRLALTRLYWVRAAWERTSGQDPASSLVRASATLAPILKVRPRWGAAQVLRGALDLEEAYGLSASGRALKAREAMQAFSEAFSLNRNLIGEWKSLADQAQHWGAATP